MNKCPKCGNLVKAGSKFCTKCGEALMWNGDVLVTQCPNCGATVKAGANFCPKCGHAMNDNAEGVVESYDEERQNTPKKRFKLKSVIVACCVACALYFGYTFITLPENNSASALESAQDSTSESTLTPSQANTISNDPTLSQQQNVEEDENKMSPTDERKLQKIEDRLYDLGNAIPQYSQLYQQLAGQHGGVAQVALTNPSLYHNLNDMFNEYQRLCHEGIALGRKYKDESLIQHFQSELEVCNYSRRDIFYGPQNGY